jgi:hypothetical protein
LKEYATKLKFLKKIVCISPVETLPNSIEIWRPEDIEPIMNKTNKGLNTKSIMVRSCNQDSMDYIVNLAELGRNWLICIDEIFLYQKGKRLQELSQMRRHSNTSICFTERRPAMVDKRFINECDMLAIFRQREPNTLKYLTEYVEEIGKDTKEIIQNLKDYHYYVYSTNSKINGQIYQTKKL